MSLKQMRIDRLKHLGVNFDTHNNDEHVVITTLLGVMDYWPSTDKFRMRGGDSGVGITNMLHCVGINPPVEADDIPRLKARIIELEALLEKARAHNGKLPWE